VMVTAYSHDIATAFLAVSGFSLIMLYYMRPEGSSPDLIAFYSGICHKVTLAAKLSLAWILIAGVPRTIFYKEYEWSETAGDLQIVAIIIKHVVMFLLVGTGLFYWHRLPGRLTELKKGSPVEMTGDEKEVDI